GANLRARRCNLTVTDAAVLQLGSDPCPINPLQTISAFFHDTSRTHSHIRILHQLFGSGESTVEFEKIEAPDLVRAIVRAVTRPDAPVINLQIQSFIIMHRRANRANELARRVLAVHTSNWLMIEFRFVRRAGVITIDSDPVHFTTDRYLMLADDGTVVFSLACDHAGVAANEG